MSIESDFRALLAGRAELVALVGQGIAQNAVPANLEPPYVVFTAEHELTETLLGELADDTAALTVECWGRNPIEADEVALQVMLAIDAAPLLSYAAVLSRNTAFDPDLGLDATVLTVEWTATPA